MSFVALLISDPARPVITDALARDAGKRLGLADDADWLDRGVACQFPVADAMAPAAALAQLRDVVGSAPVDVAVVASAARRKRVLIADMDSTMIEQECIDELADEIGIKEHVSTITQRAMNGEIAFEPALRERVALLKGLEEAVIGKVIADRIRLAPGGKALVATMNAAGAATALVSGGFESFTGPVAAMLGFREHRANRLLADGGLLTGLVAEPILGKAAKAASLYEIAAREGVGPADVIAVGDGANDLDMIEIAGMGVALHAKPAVAEQAGIRIDHGDLTALLYLQGYRRGEFVE